MTLSDSRLHAMPDIPESGLDTIRQIMDYFAKSDCSDLKMTANGVTLELRRGSAPAHAQPAPAPDARMVEASSPGVFYLTPGEGAAPFVSVGDMIAEGAQIGLMEAMKVFSEVRSDIAGRVAEVLVANGTTVTPGTPLMRVEG